MDTNSDERVSYMEFIAWLFRGSQAATAITKKVFGGPETAAEAMQELMEFLQELKDEPTEGADAKAPNRESHIEEQISYDFIIFIRDLFNSLHIVI